MSLDATIKINSETRAALNALKRGGETQDAVIRRLIMKNVPITIPANRPDPSFDTAGLLWQTRETGNNKTRTWQCVQNSEGDYEWIQTGIST